MYHIIMYVVHILRSKPESRSWFEESFYKCATCPVISSFQDSFCFHVIQQLLNKWEGLGKSESDIWESWKQLEDLALTNRFAPHLIIILTNWFPHLIIIPTNRFAHLIIILTNRFPALLSIILTNCTSSERISSILNCISKIGFYVLGLFCISFDELKPTISSVRTTNSSI